MTRLRTVQTNFTAGELAPALRGRGDLRVYANGAARLRNVFIHPTGGLSRRDGLYSVDRLPGRPRLVAFEFNTEQVYLLAFTAGRIAVYRGDRLEASLVAPWGEAALAQIAWTQSADTLLVCHPDHQPQRLTRRGADHWTLEPWAPAIDDTDQGSLSRAPFYRFAPADVTLAASAAEGAVTLTASADVFTSAHAGSRLRIGAAQATLTAIHDGRHAAAVLSGTLADTRPTVDWAESAWSAARGWPVSATFHQDRLVIGGARDLPNRLWLSRSGDLFNFDIGTGLDDEAIEFAILSDQVNAIRWVFSGRHLQVFTSGAEWMVSGAPLTPQTVQLDRQTRIGSAVGRTVPPRDVDGATLFVARNGRELREFLYTDLEQAYRSVDLALLAGHLVAAPVDQDYDQRRRLLHVVMADGTLATLTAYRAEQVTAWTRQETAGAFGAVAVVGDTVYAAVDRGGWMLERFAPGIWLDSALDGALDGAADPPTAVWTGLDHLEGREVRVVADGIDKGAHRVREGAVTLATPARTAQIGLPYGHSIEPMPPFIEGGSQGLALRPVESVFRLLETQALTLDLGRGPRAVPLRRLNEAVLFDAPPPRFTGDRRLRHLGWTRTPTTALWRIEQDAPLPFTLLSVTTELKVND